MLPEAKPARKPRRLGLFGPFLLLAIAAAVWSGGWYWLKGQVEHQMDAAAAQVKHLGGELSWKTRTVTGFPFRLDVTLTDARAADGSGWAISLPKLSGEAFPYAINHWVFVAPEGAVIHRPAMGSADARGGDVTIAGEALRASVVVEKGEAFPRVTVDGSNLTFITPQGAEPFWMQSVERVVLRLAPGPNDQGALMLSLKGAKARLTGLVARIAQNKPVELNWESTFTHASALKGRDWPGVVKSWRDAGGRLSVSANSRITGGEAVFAVKSGDLGVSPTGRLAGRLDTELKEAPRALMVMGQEGKVEPIVASAAAVAAATQQDANQAFPALILFEDDKVKLGPLPLMESPRVY